MRLYWFTRVSIWWEAASSRPSRYTPPSIRAAPARMLVIVVTGTSSQIAPIHLIRNMIPRTVRYVVPHLHNILTHPLRLLWHRFLKSCDTSVRLDTHLLLRSLSFDPLIRNAVHRLLSGADYRFGGVSQYQLRYRCAACRGSGTPLVQFESQFVRFFA